MLSSLEPKEVWNYFSAINNIPRASKKEEQIIDYMLSFGKELGLESYRDEVGNVLIKKPASDGNNHKKTVVLQSHLDMVHQKNADTIFDFSAEGIRMHIDGDWVKAEGTTLGADNGLGVATIMALLASKDISHPPLEALFTIDEETGMTGAKGLESGFLTGDILLNLDTEQDNEITIGCAGGLDITAVGEYPISALTDQYSMMTLHVKGLKGGHSGMDIHKGLGNANKLLTRILYALNEHAIIHIAEIDGGGLRNAIPREAKARFAYVASEKQIVENTIDDVRKAIQQEYSALEPDLQIQFNSENKFAPTEVMDAGFQTRLINALQAVHNGVFRMSPAIADLVETSNNVARVIVKNGKFEIMCLTRSSVESSKMNLAITIQSVFDLLGADVEFSGDYPGWEPEADGELVKLVSEQYRSLFHEEPHVNACHAGLECGIIGEKFPTMKMVSIGPTILGAHSPDERVSISSVQKFWRFFLEVIKHTP